MTPSHSDAHVDVQTKTLLADYKRWLSFVTASRETIRKYDVELARIEKRYDNFRHLIHYLRGRMHDRSQIFGRLAIQLTGQVAQLRTDPTNAVLIQRMTQGYPAMQSLIGQLANVLATIETLYWTLRKQEVNSQKTPTCLLQPLA